MQSRSAKFATDFGTKHKKGDEGTWNPIIYWPENFENSPSSLPRVYNWYYISLVFYQLNGKYWEAWNPVMQDVLINSQRTDAGKYDGSWDPKGHWCAPKELGGNAHASGGRVYMTAMMALCLEVFYRLERVEG